MSEMLPKIVAGPIIRHTSENEITFWMFTSSHFHWSFELFDPALSLLQKTALSDKQAHHIQVGQHAWIVLLTIPFTTPISTKQRYFYDLIFQLDDQVPARVSESLKDITYTNSNKMSFVYSDQLSNVLHGSCRKPHHQSVDGLVQVDKTLEQAFDESQPIPDVLMMSGDQVYIDDVAGPMLSAVHQTIKHLGLFDEQLPIESIENSKQLLTHEKSYYQRPELLPDDVAQETILSVFFGAKKKPIFTSVNANNHLVSFAEVIAMYALVWSPEMWRLIDDDKSQVAPQFIDLYEQEAQQIRLFQQGLNKVRRALAHIPVYMIFDDHDVTDDWNLTRGWEDAVYNHPFAKRIVGNALIGYWLCQGWGNQPSKFTSLVEQKQQFFSADGVNRHDELIDQLLDWDQWHYSLPTTPKMVVLDTRTQRWRSESSLIKPSGLMDWEALCELQQELIGQPSVILVSAAPVFGVKLIETVQKIFTFFGKALMVDAENWMAHKGTASVMLNIFRHHKTPPNFVILSGDVHYSFVYDITLKFRRNSPRITQITSSGIKNEFPESLLNWFDRLNRLLYASKSPLNWFTQRRNMTIKHRRPSNQKIRTLLNCSGIGQIKINADCSQVEAQTLRAKDGKAIRFK